MDQPFLPYWNYIDAGTSLHKTLADCIILDNVIRVCGHLQVSLWVNAPELVPSASFSSPNTAGMLPYVSQEPISLMKTEHFFLFKSFFFSSADPFVLPQTKGLLRFFSQNPGCHHILHHSLTMCCMENY